MTTMSSEIIHCQRCPRLRHYCQDIAAHKRKAYLDQTYWGRPIPGFGELTAEVVIVGLAPGAHGANRTGRIFTGDRSGEWLYRSLHASGFANQPTSTGPDDGLALQNSYITCVVKCAPPDNKPERDELINCDDYFQREFAMLSRAHVWIALGQIAFNQLWPLLVGDRSIKKPKFAHGTEVRILNQALGDQTSNVKTSGGREFDDATFSVTHSPRPEFTLLLSYHPSQQNTFTGRLTRPMFDSIFTRARELTGGNREAGGSAKGTLNS